ncbi:hypothetical protein [Natronincola ferrireducens]|uniref:Uncharacterized protein n=1 Tax=Natronincola ferrireducens TaxID=393762 RepID=A0A1G9H8V8_9FIRM|nr:hypothetical protein [Natronincola ferrireducens]SDL09386.1 hypothetical protein SAMN05660472_02588 [Natronincola ferrireducens]
MQPMMENYLALYLSITKRYSPDKALQAMGITRTYGKSKDEKIEESLAYDKRTSYQAVEGGY